MQWNKFDLVVLIMFYLIASVFEEPYPTLVYILGYVYGLSILILRSVDPCQFLSPFETLRFFRTPLVFLSDLLFFIQ